MIRTPKASAKVQVNPRLVAVLGIEGQENDTSALQISILPSAYVEIVHRKRKHIPNDYPENKQWLTVAGVAGGVVMTSG